MPRFAVLFSNQDVGNTILGWTADQDCVLAEATLMSSNLGVVSTDPQLDPTNNETAVTGVYARTAVTYLDANINQKGKQILNFPVSRGKAIYCFIQSGELIQLMFDEPAEIGS